MKDYRRGFSVGNMCKVFKVSNIAFYRAMKYLPSNRDNDNRILLFEISRIHLLSKSAHGSPRMTDELKTRGFKVSRPPVARLMSRNKIRTIHVKKFVVTTDSKHKYPVADNKLDRNFSPEAKGQVWVLDITYIRTLKGWLYTTIIMDLWDRKVIGGAQSSDMSAENTSITAWRKAVQNRPMSKKRCFIPTELCSMRATTLRIYWEAIPMLKGV